MKRVLVTGAAGNLGTLVIKYLLSEGKYEITALDLRNANAGKKLKKYRRRINIIYGDMNDSVLMDALVKDQDYIIHLGGVLPPLADLKKGLCESVEYKGTANIIKAINFYNPNCFLVYASSTTIYGDTPHATTKTKPNILDIDYYSNTKLKTERLIKDKLKNYAIIRFPLILCNPKSNSFMYNVPKDSVLEGITDNDAAYLLVSSLSKEKELTKKIWNAGGGDSCTASTREIFANVLEIYGLNFKYLLNLLFVDKNFYTHIYDDSDKLNDILEFRSDSLSSYYMRLKRSTKNRKIAKLLAKPFVYVLRKKDKMIGLALEGGGVRGSYQAGVVTAMIECGIKIDGVCGTSIGALNAAFIASGHGTELATVWRSLNMGEVFGFSKPFIKAMNEKELKLSRISPIVKEIANIILKKGIELEGLKKVVDTYLNVDELLSSDIDFGIVTVRLKDLKPMHLWKSDMKKDKIKDYVIASSFLPFFKMERLIDDNYYLDGGFNDLGPVNMMLEKGYKKVYLVKVHGVGISRKYDKEADVVVIESKRNLGSVLDLDPNRIDENIKMGYYDAIRTFKNLDGEVYVFKNKSLKFYQFLNRKVNIKTYNRVKNFFKTNNEKDTIIKALEYVMEKENINYYEIYHPYKVLRKLKKIKNNEHFIYSYLKKLKYFL